MDINKFKVVPRMGYLKKLEELNPKPKLYEIIVVHDNDEILFKLGDGEHHFNDLPYVSALEAFKDGYIYVKDPNFKVVDIDLYYHVNKDKKG